MTNINEMKNMADKLMKFEAHASGGFWIGFLDSCLNVVIALGLIGSVISLLVGIFNCRSFGAFLLSILVAVLVAFGVLLSVTLLKIAVGAARDLKAIRKVVESEA